MSDLTSRATCRGRSPRTAEAIRDYFSSGWVFLLPYLLVYLVYCVSYGLESVNSVERPFSPPLLHLFWVLHALNAALGLSCMFSRLGRDSSLSSTLPKWSPFTGIPWILLALVFIITGPFLEFPADPWDHLYRIVTWSQLSPHLYKGFSYFLAYSLTGWSPEGSRLLCLSAYSTAASLLLCWQYFKLGRAVGLGAQGAFIFVLLQSLLFGNSAFSFYRYYGLSSTIYSQIAAVALIRISIEFFAPPEHSGLFPAKRPGLVLSGVGLLLLAASSHVQGLGIAAEGIGAVVVWRLIALKPNAPSWICTAVILLSVVSVLFWPRSPAIDQMYRPSGMLNSWYGFNILSPRSYAFERGIQVIGAIGIFNLLAAVLLLRRNSVIAWLTIVPVAAMLLPLIAIPFAGSLSREGWGGIDTFNRMFLAMPAGLAVVSLGRQIANSRHSSTLVRYAGLWPMALVVCSLAAFTTIPSAGPCYDRFWNALVCSRTIWRCVPAWDGFSTYWHSASHTGGELLLSTSGVGWAIADQRLVEPATFNGKRTASIPTVDLERVKQSLQDAGARHDLVLLVLDPTAMYSSHSFASLCSHHWSPQCADLAASGSRELQIEAVQSGLRFAGAQDKLAEFSSK